MGGRGGEGALSPVLRSGGTSRGQCHTPAPNRPPVTGGSADAGARPETRSERSAGLEVPEGGRCLADGGRGATGWGQEGWRRGHLRGGRARIGWGLASLGPAPRPISPHLVPGSRGHTAGCDWRTQRAVSDARGGGASRGPGSDWRT